MSSEFDDIFDEIKRNNQSREELKKAVRIANFDSIAEILWKVAAKLLGEHVRVLKNKPWLCWIIEELVPVVFRFLRDNWNVFFPY
ncbi:hypothetical protein FJR38_26095 [Anabaena sp. UHCC 0253]|uniref:hypothetical protein n=1 Tax=Anabaena sp. UHCC 0253 TaxID=2590019 RepID=UPI0014457927|nr:hypothetical protein [Anabaena sp. UHCC 0253]MTJ55884.1 hypothetical protein [Anabaena sp. UHCC 0253]